MPRPIKNPYSPAHALHYIPAGARALLDIGCNVGENLLCAHELGIERLYGIDINPSAAETAAKRLSVLGLEDCRIVQGSATRLPFPDRSVDTALCCEVLEHVPSECRRRVIEEAARVLLPGGRLIMTMPAAGAFSFLDPANFRLRFPRTFGLASKVSGGRGREAGFVGQEHGVVWHHHFPVGELLSLLDGMFKLAEYRWRGALVAPLCGWLQFPFYRRAATESRAFRALSRLLELDMSMNWGRALAYNVLLVAVNVSRPLSPVAVEERSRASAPSLPSP